MGRIATSKESIQERLNTQFPGRGLKVLKFTTLKGEGTLECPIHGLQTVKYFANVFKSPLGCPRCGEELRGAKSAKTGEVKNSAVKTLSQIQELASSNISDQEFRVKVAELLSDASHRLP